MVTLSILESPFSSFFLLNTSLFLPPSPNVSLLSPREPKIKTYGQPWSRKHIPPSPVEGVTSCVWSGALRYFGNCFFCWELVLFLECALLLSLWDFRSSPHRTQFNLHCSVNHLLHDSGGMISEVVVNNQCTNVGI